MGLSDSAQNSEDTGAGASPPLKPRDASTLIIVDRSGLPRILLGRRRPQQVFLPNKFVFPGGRADKIDRSIPAIEELADSELAKLLVDMKGSPSSTRARGLALAALRETYEEAGLLVGQSAEGGLPVTYASAARREDGGTWRNFFDEAVAPDLAPLTFLARAITPPGRTRRYDTRFFVVDSAHIAKTVQPPDDELRDLGWFTIDEARQLDMPNITRAIIEDLNEYLASFPAGADASQWPVPFYFFKGGSFERVLLRV